MIGRRHFIGAAALAVVGSPVRAAAGFPGLAAAFAAIEAAHGGRLGVAVLDTGSGRQAGHRRDERFPLCSTFKLLAAGAVLARVDAGQERLTRRIRFSARDLVAYSPVTQHGVDGAGMTLASICEAAITQSDNTAGNLLLRTLGGPAGLTAYLRRLGDKVTRLDRWETALNEARPGDPRDTSTPGALVADVERLAVGQGLSAAGKMQLLDWLRASQTGTKRLRARLPSGWQVADKTGTGDRGTSNDIGVLWPPNGAAPLLVAAYLTEGPADDALRETALAEVGAAIAAAWLE